MAHPHQTAETAGLVIGVTGHRNLRVTELPRLRKQIHALFDLLAHDYPELPLTVLCPLAAGADQLVAGIALERGIRVIAALPVPAVLYRSDFDDPDELAEFDRQLAQCACLELALQDARSPDDIRHGGYARNRQYAHAGMFTSSHCHILLALWDGSENGHFGGTAQVVEYHLHGTLPGTVDRRQAAMGNLGLDEESLVFHIPAGRQSSESDLDGEGRWLTSGDDAQPSERIPDSFATMFRRQVEYQHDCRQYRDEILKAGNLGKTDCPIGCYFGGADWLATTYRRRVSRILLATYILAALMGYAFIMYSDIMAKDVMIYLFLLFFLAGIGINSVAKRREWHRQYIDSVPLPKVFVCSVIGGARVSLIPDGRLLPTTTSCRSRTWSWAGSVM